MHALATKMPRRFVQSSISSKRSSGTSVAIQSNYMQAFRCESITTYGPVEEECASSTDNCGNNTHNNAIAAAATFAANGATAKRADAIIINL